MGFPGTDWLTAFRDKANADRELAVIGRHFTVCFTISFGDMRCLFDLRAGQTFDVERAPRFDRPVAFGLRAPMGVWRKFFAKAPPPLFHDIFPMLMRVPEFVIEGNSLAAMQNARALQRYMTIMQAQGGENG